MTLPWWFIVVAGGHFFTALAFVIDKYLLTKSIPRPRQYSFYIGAMGAAAVVLIPFGVTLVSWQLMSASIASGALFVLALYAFFSALKTGEASRIPVIIGSLNPVIIFFLSYVYLHERLSVVSILSLVAIIVGGILISLTHARGTRWKLKGFGMSLVAAVLFSVSYTLAKHVFNHSTFITGFTWMRMGGAGMAALYLVAPGGVRAVFPRASHHESPKKHHSPRAFVTMILFLIGQTLGALGFVLLSYALTLTSATLVNALQSLQYVLLFIVTIMLSLIYPRIIKEDITSATITQKIFALILIAVGIFGITH